VTRINAAIRFFCIRCDNTLKRFVVNVFGKWSFKMSVLAQSFSQSIRPVAMACGAALIARLLVAATYGLDLSAGFF
jgi:hypothetical protein